MGSGNPGERYGGERRVGYGVPDRGWGDGMMRGIENNENHANLLCPRNKPLFSNIVPRFGLQYKFCVDFVCDLYSYIYMKYV